MATKKRVSKGTRFTEQEFNLLKELQKSGYNTTQVKKLLQRGAGTVHYAWHSDTFAEYMQARLQHNENYKKLQATQEPVQEQPVVEQPVDYNVDPVVTTNHSELVAVLTRIADGIERLAEAWENKPKKKWL